MVRQDKETEVDALIEILKSLVEECKAVYKGASSRGTNEIQGGSLITVKEEGDILGTLWYLGGFNLPCTIGNLNLYAMADLRASVNIMPISSFKHLKLVDLKETNKTVVMADMTEKTPLGIAKNVLVKIDKFLFFCDFIITDTKGEPNESIILRRSFLAMIHAQIDVFKGKFSLGIGEDIVFVDMDENQHSRFCDDESIGTVDLNDEMQEPKDGHKENYGMWPTCNLDLSFCSGYNAIYRKGENGMLEQWICFRDYKRQSIRGNRMTFTDFLKVRYGSKNIEDMTRERRYYEWITQNTEFEDDSIPNETIKYENHCEYHHEFPHSYFSGVGKKRYALDDVWEKCKKFHDTTYRWHDEGFEEEEQWESGIEKKYYEPSFVKSETFEVKRYSFKNGKSFVFSQQGIGIRSLLGSLSCGKQIPV
ncbi:phospholipase-like protein [Tanacetum coccineum]